MGGTSGLVWGRRVGEEEGRIPIQVGLKDRGRKEGKDVWCSWF